MFVWTVQRVLICFPATFQLRPRTFCLFLFVMMMMNFDKVSFGQGTFTESLTRQPTLGHCTQEKLNLTTSVTEVTQFSSDHPLRSYGSSLCGSSVRNKGQTFFASAHLNFLWLGIPEEFSVQMLHIIPPSLGRCASGFDEPRQPSEGSTQQTLRSAACTTSKSTGRMSELRCVSLRVRHDPLQKKLFLCFCICSLVLSVVFVKENLDYVYLKWLRGTFKYLRNSFMIPLMMINFL